jgi:DNA-binding transcriptional regulator GbsR (MarR family)
MSADDPDAVTEDVIESMERSAEVYGLSRSAGRVYGVLYFSEDPLSIPELVEETGYAKSTISTVTRKLTRIGLIRRRSSSGGGRRVEFQPETDVWFVVQDVFQQFLLREMNVTQRTLDRAHDRLSALDEEAHPELQRVESLRATYDDLETLLQLSTEYSAGELVDAIEQYDG